MAPRLKVFVTSDGLTEYVVATTSKAKALEAWGIHQDVFKTGHAREVDDPDVVAQASAKPGEVLRRSVDPAAALASLKASKPAPSRKAKLEPVRTPPEPKGPSKAALKKVAELERQLADLDAAQRKALAQLERDRAELERRAEAQAAGDAAKRQKLEAALSAARQALGPQ